MTRSLSRKLADRAALAAAHTAERVALPAPVRAELLAHVVSILSDSDLVAVLYGGVNVEAVLRKSLADRGLDWQGTFIGFERAEQAFDDWYSSNHRSEDGAHQGSST